MIIKPSPIHSGWSYETGDDQYDEVSLGSTTDTKEWKQSMEKSENGAKNIIVQIIGSNDKKKQHEEGRWMTVDRNKNRKEKRNHKNDDQVSNNIRTANDENNTRNTNKSHQKQVSFINEEATNE